MKKNEEIAEYLRGLSHPTRIAIIKSLLKGSKCVNNLKELLNVSQPNISQHLAILKSAGIVNCTQDGQKKCYSLNDRQYLEMILENFNK